MTAEPILISAIGRDYPQMAGFGRRRSAEDFASPSRRSARCRTFAPAAYVFCRTDGARHPPQSHSSAPTPLAGAKEQAMSIFPAPERAQIFFHVRDMTSPYSADAVMSAVLELDARAAVRIDLPMRRIEIDPTRAEPNDFRNAINDAGYSSVRQWPSERAYL